MIIVMEPDAGDREVEAVEAKIRSHGLSVHVSKPKPCRCYAA